MGTCFIVNRAANQAMQTDAVRAVRLHEWSYLPFFMQTAIAYSAADGGVRLKKEVHVHGH